MRDYSFIAHYQSARFESGAYGPDVFDCYGLVWHANRYQNDVDLPRFDDIDYNIARINAEIRGQTLSDDWSALTDDEDPADFDAVVMKRADEAYHVGLYLRVDGGRILHATPQGILCNDVQALHRMGFRDLTYYRHARQRG